MSILCYHLHSPRLLWDIDNIMWHGHEIILVKLERCLFLYQFYMCMSLIYLAFYLYYKLYIHVMKYSELLYYVALVNKYEDAESWDTL